MLTFEPHSTVVVKRSLGVPNDNDIDMAFQNELFVPILSSVRHLVDVDVWCICVELH
jgi:hypothetical protein